MRIKCQTASSNRITYSEKYSIQYGTPQGSCLGPLLFLIFCNDIYKVVEQCKLILFADDTTIFYSYKNINYFIWNLIHDLNLLFAWFKANKLSLNMEKSMAMSLGNPNANFLTIAVGDLTIPWVQEIKFLGLHIDTMLNWNHYYNLLYNKILLNKKLLALSQNILMVPAKLAIYFAHIQSHVNYAILVWKSMLSKNKLEKLFKVQKECMRCILNVGKTAHTDPIFKRLKILKLTQMIDLDLYK